MRSFRDSAGFTRAVAVERSDPLLRDQAEVIDLVHIPAGTRPTPFAGLDYDEVMRCRVLDCGTYSDCLNFAARLQWPSFHCRQCPKYVFEPSTASQMERARRARLALASGPDASVIKLR